MKWAPNQGSKMRILKRLATYLALIGTITFVVVVVAFLTSGPDNLVSHFILEGIVEPVCCFIPALLLGTIGSSAILFDRRRI